MKVYRLSGATFYYCINTNYQFVKGVVGSGNGVVYLTSPGRLTEIGLQLGKACYPCSR